MLTQTASIDTTEVCTSPSSQICDPAKNKYISKIIGLDYQWNKSEVAIDEGKELKQFVNKLSRGRSTYCWELSPPQLASCDKKRHEIAQRELFHQGDFQKFSEVFATAQKTALRFLNEQLEVLKSQKVDPKIIFNLELAISKIKDAKLNFESDEDMGAEATTDKNRPLLSVGAIHWLGNESPELVTFTLVHELGHFVFGTLKAQDTNHQYLPYDKKFPFEKQLNCLMKVVKTADLDCAKKLNKKLRLKEKNAGGSFSEEGPLSGNIRDLENNPYIDFSAGDGDTYCSPNQVDEAFADWFATEATMEAFPKGGGSLSNIDKVMSTMAKYCTYGLSEQGIKNNLNPQSYFVKRIENNTHPTFETRINKIFSNHPKIQEILGCKMLRNPTSYCPPVGAQ